MVLGDAVRRDVPAAVLAGGGFLIAAAAVQRTAEEELFQSGTSLVAQLTGIGGQVEFAAAAVAVAGTELLEQGKVMVVDAARHHALAVTQGTGAAELGLDASRFNACVDSHKYKSVVDADIKDGNAAGF